MDRSIQYPVLNPWVAAGELGICILERLNCPRETNKIVRQKVRSKGLSSVASKMSCGFMTSLATDTRGHKEFNGPTAPPGLTNKFEGHFRVLMRGK